VIKIWSKFDNITSILMKFRQSLDQCGGKIDHSLTTFG